MHTTAVLLSALLAGQTSALALQARTVITITDTKTLTHYTTPAPIKTTHMVSLSNVVNVPTAHKTTLSAFDGPHGQPTRHNPAAPAKTIATAAARPPVVTVTSIITHTNTHWITNAHPGPTNAPPHPANSAPEPNGSPAGLTVHPLPPVVTSAQGPGITLHPTSRPQTLPKIVTSTVKEGNAFSFPYPTKTPEGGAKKGCIYPLLGAEGC